MARGDPLYARLDVNWAGDKRCIRLGDPATKWLYLVLYMWAVELRREGVASARRDLHAIAARACLGLEETRRSLRRIRKTGLIRIASGSGMITVVGARNKHRRLGWKDGPPGSPVQAPYGEEGSPVQAPYGEEAIPIAITAEQSRAEEKRSRAGAGATATEGGRGKKPTPTSAANGTPRPASFQSLKPVLAKPEAGIHIVGTAATEAKVSLAIVAAVLDKGRKPAWVLADLYTVRIRKPEVPAKLFRFLAGKGEPDNEKALVRAFRNLGDEDRPLLSSGLRMLAVAVRNRRDEK